DPERSLKTWCEALARQEGLFLRLFPKTLRETLLGQGQENSTIIGVPIAGGYVPKLYQIWLNLNRVIQAAKREHTGVTGLTLLQTAFPMVGDCYEELFKQSEAALKDNVQKSRNVPDRLKAAMSGWSLPLQRYLSLTAKAYDWKQGHSVSQMTSKRYLDIRKLDKKTLINRPEAVGPQTALKELEQALTEGSRIERIRSSLMKGDLEPFLGTYLDKTKSAVLAGIDFAKDIKDKKQERQIVGSLLKQSAIKIYLKGSETVTDEQLSRLLSQSRFLTHLTLERCNKVTGQFLVASRHTRVLRRVKILDCENFQVWPTHDEVRGWFSRAYEPLTWPNLRHLAIQGCPLNTLAVTAPKLVEVTLAGLAQLTQPTFITPNLKQIKLHGMSQVNERQLAHTLLKANPDNLAAYGLLMKGQHLDGAGMPITLSGLSQALKERDSALSGMQSADLSRCTHLGTDGLMKFMALFPHCESIT
ncbi:MAG: hypothetical protein AB7I18_13350, partial [Candidatus Berkiella sp.]